MLHAAAGAMVGRVVRSRPLAAIVGFGLHLAGDGIPHQDTEDEAFELVTGLAGLGLVAWRRGLLDPATIGAVACCLPDAEHLIPLPQPGGMKLFHDGRGWHPTEPGGISVQAQIGLAALLLLAVGTRRRVA